MRGVYVYQLAVERWRMAFNFARNYAFAPEHVHKAVKAHVGKFQVDRAVSRAGGYFYYAGGLGALAAGFREKLPAKALRMDGYGHCYAADQIAHLGRFAVYRKYIRQSVLPTAMKVHQYVRVGRFAVYGSGKLMGYAPAFVARENAVQINRVKRAPALHAAHCRCVYGGYYLYRALYGRILYKMAYKPLRTAPRMSLMISAIGVSYLIQNLAFYLTGGLPQPVKTPIPWISDTVTLFGASTKRVTVVTPVLTIALVFALVALIKKTKIGMGMRAAAKDFETAQLMGVKINSVISMTFVIGSFLAAVGAFLIGLCEEIIKGLGQSTFSDAFTFALLIIVLCVKPTGLFGEKVTDKV